MWVQPYGGWSMRWRAIREEKYYIFNEIHFDFSFLCIYTWRRKNIFLFFVCAIFHRGERSKALHLRRWKIVSFETNDCLLRSTSFSYIYRVVSLAEKNLMFLVLEKSFWYNLWTLISKIGKLDNLIMNFFLLKFSWTSSQTLQIFTILTSKRISAQLRTAFSSIPTFIWISIEDCVWIRGIGPMQ